MALSLFPFYKQKSPRHPRDTELLRSELFSIEQLKRHAVKLATEHTLSSSPGADKLLPRLADNEKVLLAAYRVITGANSTGNRLIAAEAWLLDNYYLIEKQIIQVRRHLPHGYSKQLPRLATGISADFPRIYDLALALISHMDGRVDGENASHIILAYQSVEPLKLGELWAFPIMLQLALLENLRRVALRIARRREERDEAILWADRMLDTAENEPKKLIQLLAKFADADIPLTAPFVEEFYERLQVQGSVMSFVQSWVEQKLLEQGVTATQLSEVSDRKAAANQISIANSIGSLRFIDNMDWRNYVESLSVVEHCLLGDPSQRYITQDFATRDRYRHVIEEVARSGYCSEIKVAEQAILLASAELDVMVEANRKSHVGYFLVDEGRQQLEFALNCNITWKLQLGRICRRWKLTLYLLPIFLLTGIFSVLTMLSFADSGFSHLHLVLMVMPLLIVTSAFSIAFINLLVTQLLPPHVLPRLDFSKGIPEACRTMVIVPTLLNFPEDIDRLLEALEIRYLGNRDANLFFALLTDSDDAVEEILPQDAVLLSYAREKVEALNLQYKEDRPCIFYLFHRPRLWNPTDQVWMGYERKRGKLEQFNALLRQTNISEAFDNSDFSEIVGDVSILHSIQYVITLDTDTQLPRDCARTLVGNMAHPLNRPVYDAKKDRIIKGYAILQPRASVSLLSAGQSRFSKIYAGESGIDPYTREISDVYQDIFAEGSFIGKGIYDVDAFRQVLDGRFPESLVLSHDLLESAYARSGLVTDVDLIEEYPSNYLVEVSRRHRWIRGDWQLIGWLLPRIFQYGQMQSKTAATDFYGKSHSRPQSLSPLSNWKIFDNLRRSLVPIALLLLLITGWFSGETASFLPVLIVVAVLFTPALSGLIVAMIRKPDELDWWLHLHMAGHSAVSPMMIGLLSLVMLPYEALIGVNAILQSGGRMLFTKRGLLLWKLPSYAARNSARTLQSFAKEMWFAPAFVLVITSAMVFQLKFQGFLWFELGASILILLLWLLSPLVAWYISKPVVSKPLDLTVMQRGFLRTSARRTWRFFAEFVTANDHWLPPDNFQETPTAVIASRTSPTNIGMALLANLTAHDFGYINTAELLQLTDNTLTSMEKLERYRGHFYNWYDTLTLQPLRPQYISSVDSGNLLGSLLTLQMGLAELKDKPVFSLNVFHGLQDTLLVLLEQAETSGIAELVKKINLLKQSLAELMPEVLTANELTKIKTQLSVESQLAEIKHQGQALTNLLPTEAHNAELVYWVNSFNQQVGLLLEDLGQIFPYINSQSEVPTPRQLLETVVMNGQIPECHAFIVERLNRIERLIERCQALAAMDFEFLYDTSCNLLSIGYDVTERRLDPSCYDLLASEARLASFLLIAQGQVPQKHWFSLGRLLTSHGGDVSLISWSGSMFEYLMPQLIMPSYANTLLDETCKAVVARQIEYGKQRGIPWGISESCYNVTDLNQTYQYRAFGVPGLGFKRGLGDDLVIAPYASALALIVNPREACKNLQAMADQGFLGAYGFYEAIDYTPSRLPPGKQQVIVRSYMAHHQGMSFLAFGHVLLGQLIQNRFMAMPIVQATALLLQERVPKQSATLYPHAAEVSATARPATADIDTTMRVFKTPNTSIPEVHLLSNGRYHVMANNAGGGYSRWNDLAVTRWREDAITDNWGTFIYLRDCHSGYFWSNAFQPTLKKADEYEAIFVQARAEYRRVDYAIETRTEISVSPEDDVEIRRVTLNNLSSRERMIELTTYAEVVLAPPNADLAHRTFSNLFVETEILPERQAILCTRRRRSANEKVPWMFHLMAAPGIADYDWHKTSFETDRAKFIGRCRTSANPVMMEDDSDQHLLSNTQGAVLDPVVAIRRRIHLVADQSAVIQIVSGVAETREAALVLLDKYCDKHFVERAFEMAWFQSQEVLRHLNASEADAILYDRLASSIIYTNASRRAAPAIIARNRLGQSVLWRFGVSGDLPIVLIQISDINRIDLIKQILQAHSYWRKKGLVVDLVILNEDFSGYRALLQDQIMGLINAGSEVHIIDRPGGVFVRRTEELSEEDKGLLQAVASIVLNDNSETLLEKIEQGERRVSSNRVQDALLFQQELTPWISKLTQTTTQPITDQPDPKMPAVPARTLLFANGIGGFTPDGREYVITLQSGQSTPAPWVNVIASPYIGTVVSESGGAYTWVENAHEFRLTTWHNDPLSDPSGEAFYIRDEDSGAFWSPTPLPAAGKGSYTCRHGFGYSVFEHDQAGIRSEVCTYVAMNAAVKFLVVKLRNHSGRTRQLSLTAYWELVLGEWRHANMMHIVTEADPYSGAIFARNAYGRECGGRVVFVHFSEPEQSLTCSRGDFIGRNGSLANPLAMRRKRLSGRTGAALDPCAAILAPLELEDGQEHEYVFILGAARNAEEAQHAIQRFGRPAGARQAFEAVGDHWRRTLSDVQVETPDIALNVMTNGWLLYQTLSSRIWGRSGYYQSGGAYGFRDQLQDSLALIHTSPWLVREQLIRCAERQFSQGDVQHWWHPPHGQGVRTHFSDDYLWLVHVTCRYVNATGDVSVLDQSVNFIDGRNLSPDEEAYYDLPLHSQDSASLYEHCARAIKHGLRFGLHGLPLMGCGDWNDGMNLVGSEGKGESVWLGWFLYDNLQQFAKLAEVHHDHQFAHLCIEQSETLRRNIEAQAWDGNWYRRAYFDDGTPLGSVENSECQIDSISQSWAVISTGGDLIRARQAMAAVDERLVKREAGLIQLLDPPFDKSALEPGYIKGYVPGVRENGGQYTHAAIWTTMAFAMLGQRKKAWELYAMLNPIHHAKTQNAVNSYKVEPYVMSADIYASPPHTGRGGWTWYTGAAGWMYRLTLETLLGVNLQADKLIIRPCMPDDWATYKIHYRYHDTNYHITIRRGLPETLGTENKSQPETLSELVITLVNDGQEHEITFTVD